MTDSPNGNEQIENAPKWYHDPDTGAFFDSEDKPLGFAFYPKELIFEASNGWKLKFKDFNQQTLLDFQQRFEKKFKPKVPRKAYDIGDGDVSWESDPNDASYIEALDAYNIELGLLIQTLQLSFGLDFKVPPEDTWEDDFADLIELSFDDSTPYLKHAIRRKYIEWQLNKKHEYEVLVRLVQGRSLPTMEEVRSEEQRFPSTN